jgi:hypothetical protein
LQQDLALNALLYAVLVSNVLLGVWGFVHIGSGSNSSVSVPRYGFGAAELLVIVAAITAAAAWSAINRRKFGAYAVIVGLVLGVAWNLSMGSPPSPEAVEKLPEQAILVKLTVGFFGAAALALWLMFARAWDSFEN